VTNRSGNVTCLSAGRLGRSGWAMGGATRGDVHAIRPRSGTQCQASATARKPDCVPYKHRGGSAGADLKEGEGSGDE
jgi:hypothetical protein